VNKFQGKKRIDIRHAYTFKDKNCLPVTATTWQPVTTALRDDTAFRSQVINMHAPERKKKKN